MVQITAAEVKKLRDATNVSMMECKKALQEAGGEMDKAIRLLREQGLAMAARRADRAANQGLVATADLEGRRIVSLVEVNCETDFVARNEVFRNFVQEMARRACVTDEALATACNQELASTIAALGENIVLRRNVRFRLREPGLIQSYIHLGGKIGVLVELGCTKADTPEKAAFRELARDLALHVAAAGPQYLADGDIPAEVLAVEREIYAKQVTGKPPQVVDKIVAGKLRKKFYAEVCLLEQSFIKNPEVPVRALLAEKSKELAEALEIRRFARYHIGA